MSALFVDDADGFVAAFGSLTKWNHAYRAGNDRRFAQLGVCSCCQAKNGEFCLDS